MNKKLVIWIYPTSDCLMVSLVVQSCKVHCVLIVTTGQPFWSLYTQVPENFNKHTLMGAFELQYCDQERFRGFRTCAYLTPEGPFQPRSGLRQKHRMQLNPTHKKHLTHVWLF